MTVSPDQPPEDRPQGITLEELTAAFAEAMSGPTRPVPVVSVEPQPETSEAANCEAADLTEPAETDPDACCPISPRSILEAMLFVGNRDGQALSPAQAVDLMRGVTAGEVADLVDQLNLQYAAENRPYHVANEGAGYRMTLRPSFARLRDQFYHRVREARLSQAAVDILALVAYQQPLSGEQVNRLRGKPSGHILSQLVHRGLLRIDPDQRKPRTKLYYTTERFLSLFGLQSLDDLPRD
jgi:segregation and condensation protein B